MIFFALKCTFSDTNIATPSLWGKCLHDIIFLSFYFQSIYGFEFRINFFKAAYGWVLIFFFSTVSISAFCFVYLDHLHLKYLLI